MTTVVLCLLLSFVLSPTVAFASVRFQAATPEQSKSDVNSRIEDNVQAVLQGDPLLSGAQVQTKVDDQSITLTGTVESYAQHQRVLQLVEPYVRWRKVVDKIRVGGTTQKT